MLCKILPLRGADPLTGFVDPHRVRQCINLLPLRGADPLTGFVDPHLVRRCVPGLDGNPLHQRVVDAH